MQRAGSCDAFSYLLIVLCLVPAGHQLATRADPNTAQYKSRHLRPLLCTSVERERALKAFSYTSEMGLHQESMLRCPLPGEGDDCGRAGSAVWRPHPGL